MTSCALVIAALSAARSVVVLVALLVSVLVADFEGEHASTSKSAGTPREARVWIMSASAKRFAGKCRGHSLVSIRRPVMKWSRRCYPKDVHIALGIGGGREAPSAACAGTPLLTQAMTRSARGRSCLSRLPPRAARARPLPRQEEIAARLTA